MQKVSSNVWFKGAFILTIGAFITKILSAVYRIPFQNIVGDTGFYIYQQVYPFYGVVIALSTYGFPVVLSKVYMEWKLEEDQSSLGRLISTSFILLFPLGFIMFMLLFFGSQSLALWMGDPSLAPLFKVVAFTFLLAPFIAIMRGIFQGEGEMLPTAVSQVGEQVVRVGTILFVATFFTYKGFSLYTIGAGAMFGSVTGGLLSLLVMLYYYKKAGYPFSFFRFTFLRKRGNLVLYRRLLFEGFTISISSMLLILLQLADSLTVFPALLEAGMETNVAKMIKGVYDRGQPLIQMGTVISMSMALTIVPFITKERYVKDRKRLINLIRFSLTVSFFIGLGATVGLQAIIHETNGMLFRNDDGSGVLALLCTIIFLNALIATMVAILQGLGHSFLPAALILVSFCVKYGLNILFVNRFGIEGAAISSIAVLGLLLILLVVLLRYIVKGPIIPWKAFLQMALAACSMFLVLKGYILLTDYLFSFIDSRRTVDTIQAITGVMVGGFIYVLFVIRGNIFKEEELSLLPFGSKLTLFLPKKRKG